MLGAVVNQRTRSKFTLVSANRVSVAQGHATEAHVHPRHVRETDTHEHAEQLPPRYRRAVALDVDTLVFTAQPPGTAHDMEVQQDAEEIQARPRALHYQSLAKTLSFVVVATMLSRNALPTRPATRKSFRSRVAFTKQITSHASITGNHVSSSLSYGVTSGAIAEINERMRDFVGWQYNGKFRGALRRTNGSHEHQSTNREPQVRPHLAHTRQSTMLFIPK